MKETIFLEAGATQSDTQTIIAKQDYFNFDECSFISDSLLWTISPNHISPEGDLGDIYGITNWNPITKVYSIEIKTWLAETVEKKEI